MDVIHGEHGEKQVGLFLGRTRLVMAGDERVLYRDFDTGREVFADEMGSDQLDIAECQALIPAHLDEVGYQIRTECQPLILEMDAEIEPVNEKYSLVGVGHLASLG